MAANSFRNWYSSDGVSWIPVVANQAYTCTPTHIGFFVSSWTATADFLYTFEYLRVY